MYLKRNDMMQSIRGIHFIKQRVNISARLTTPCPPPLAAAHLGVSLRSSACVWTGWCRPGPGIVWACSSETLSPSAGRADSGRCRSETHCECNKELEGERILDCYSSNSKSQDIESHLARINCFHCILKLLQREAVCQFPLYDFPW